MSSIDVRSVPDLHIVPERMVAPSRAAPRRQSRRHWGTTILRVLGGFVLTGFFLGLSVVVFALSGIYGFLEIAKF